MMVATSFNLSYEAARYDAAMPFKIGISELKTSQNEMQPFHKTSEKCLHIFQSFLLTFRSKSVNWDFFLPRVGGYNGHK